MDAEIKQWMLTQIEAAEKRRDWSALPPDWEVTAVTHVFMRIKPHFDRKADIGTRIAASKATSFVDLREAITGKECSK